MQKRFNLSSGRIFISAYLLREAIHSRRYQVVDALVVCSYLAVGVDLEIKITILLTVVHAIGVANLWTAGRREAATVNVTNSGKGAQMQQL